MSTLFNTRVAQCTRIAAFYVLIDTGHYPIITIPTINAADRSSAFFAAKDRPMVPVGSIRARRIFFANPAAVVQRNFLLARPCLGVGGFPVVKAVIVGDGNKVLIAQTPLVVASTLTLLESFGNPVGKFTNANVVGAVVLVLVVVHPK